MKVRSLLSEFADMIVKAFNSAFDNPWTKAGRSSFLSQVRKKAPCWRSSRTRLVVSFQIWCRCLVILGAMRLVCVFEHLMYLDLNRVQDPMVVFHVCEPSPRLARG